MIMKKRFLSLLCGGILMSASALAQDYTLAPELAQQVNQIAETIKSNPEEADDSFSALLKGKNKKNETLVVAIGEAYLANNDLKTAKSYAERGMELDSRSALVCTFAGDVALAEKNIGEACGYYEQAIMIDPDYRKAYYKYAQAYAEVYPQLAVDMLLKLKERHPDEINADRELAKTYYTMGKYSQAKSALDEFMQKGEPQLDDYSRYAMLLYLNKDYAQSLEMCGKGIALDPENTLLKRLNMYNLYELKNYAEGLKAADALFAEKGDTEFVYLDHLYRGRIYKANNDSINAMTAFEEAMKADTENQHPEIAKEASEAYEDYHMYPDAIRMYKIYLDKIKDKAEVSDLFLLGRLYYMAAGMPDAGDEKPAYLMEADTIFAQVSERVPDNYLGYFWRARVNAMSDPETTEGLAKPYYEKALSILENNPKASKSILIECESYLGYYYFQKEDYEQSKVYWNKILELDPENAVAKQALEGLK